MKSVIEVIGYDNCTGCYGCYNKCKIEGAIELKLTDDGFYKPFITDKCINCGECQKACPVITKVNENKIEERETFASWSKDENILMNSSSGGLFSEIAKYFLENNGVVFGAGWNNGEVQHFSINKLEKLSLLQKSKYLQSKVENSYNNVIKNLEEGKKVLFVGTPCQVASLNTLVKDKTNLLTIDLVCHGIPSYKAYEKYIKETFDKDKKDIEVDFRNKEDKGWKIYYIYYKYNKYKNILKQNHSENTFFKGFLSNIYLNSTCYDCEFRSSETRYGDITLADFWGVPKEIENPKGTSVLILNNEKAKRIIKEIEDRIILKKVDYQLALNGNPCLGKYKMDDSKRQDFFREIEQSSFQKLSEKYGFKPKEKGLIKRLVRHIKKLIK